MAGITAAEAAEALGVMARAGVEVTAMGDDRRSWVVDDAEWDVVAMSTDPEPVAEQPHSITFTPQGVAAVKAGGERHVEPPARRRREPTEGAPTLWHVEKNGREWPEVLANGAIRADWFSEPIFDHRYRGTPWYEDRWLRARGVPPPGPAPGDAFDKVCAVMAQDVGKALEPVLDKLEATLRERWEVRVAILGVSR